MTILRDTAKQCIRWNQKNKKRKVETRKQAGWRVYINATKFQTLRAGIAKDSQFFLRGI